MALRFPLADDAETAQVAEMRAALKDELAAVCCGKWPDVTGDVRLLRFLRGFDNDVPKALAAVRDLLAIRRQYAMDDYHERWAHVECHHERGHFPRQNDIHRLKPGAPTLGLSKDGCPVGYEPLRDHWYGKCLDEIGEDGMIEFYVAQCESRNMQLHQLSEAQGRMAKLILVIDLRSVSLWQLTSRKWAKFDEAHQRVINRTLAEIIARIYVINTPRWALWWYKTIEWWVPVKTRGKIRLLGTDYRAELLEVMDEEIVEAMLAFDGPALARPEREREEATPPCAPAADTLQADVEPVEKKGLLEVEQHEVKLAAAAAAAAAASTLPPAPQQVAAAVATAPNGHDANGKDMQIWRFA